MKTPALKNRRSGSAIIYALVVMAAGAMVMAGWIYLLAARANYTEQMSAALQRRITLENSRQLASQYVLQNVLSGTFSGTASLTVMSGSDTAASCSIPSASAVIPLSSVNVVNLRNGFAPGGFAGFTQDLNVTLSDGETNFSWLFRARSRSPIFGYDLLTSQKPASVSADVIDFSSGLNIGDNVVVWSPVSVAAFNLRTGTYQTSTAGSLSLPAPQNGSGQTVVMSNFAFPPVTSGNGYAGTISVIDPGGTYPNSLVGKNSMASAVTFVGSNTNSYTAYDFETSGTTNYLWSGTSGVVNVRLFNEPLDKLYVPGNTTRLVLKGQTTGYTASGTTAALLIVVNDTTNSLQNIDLQNNNNRLLYLAVKKPSPGNVTVTVTNSGAATWRLAGVLENTSLTINAPNGINVSGGLRTDGSVVVNSGAVNISREATPNRLDEYADRIGWLESYRQ